MSRSAGPSHIAPSRAPPPSSAASVHSHRSTTSRHSSQGSELPPTSTPAKAPTVVPSDSISQVGSRAAETHPSTSRFTGHGSFRPSPLSHYSVAPDAASETGSQQLTEANLQAHDVGARSRPASVAPVEYEVEVEEERTARRSYHSGKDIESPYAGYRPPTVASASAASSSKTLKAAFSKIGTTVESQRSSRRATRVPSHARSASLTTRTVSQAGSKTPSAVPSHARSVSPSSRSQMVAASKAESVARSQIWSAGPSHARSDSASSRASQGSGTAVDSQTRSRTPTSAPVEEYVSHAVSASVSKPGTLAPSTLGSSNHSVATQPSSPTPLTSPQAPSRAPTRSRDAESPPPAGKSAKSRTMIPSQFAKHTDLSTEAKDILVVEVEKVADQIVQTEYKIQRRHVYPINAN